MELLANKDIKRFFTAIVLLCLLLLSAGLVFPRVIVGDMKAQLLQHDAEVTGFLLRQGVSPSCIAQALSSPKTAETVSSGRAFLDSLGYRGGALQIYPDADAFFPKYLLIFSCSAILAALALFAAFVRCFRRQKQTLDRACQILTSFMEGDTSLRLESEREGSLSRLFASVNGMATALNAHRETEKQSKEFLKRTMEDISHQLKTPLASLRMCNDIIRTESGNEESVGRFSEKAELALDHMERLILNLLKLSRLDAGAVPFKMTEQRLESLLKKTVSGFELRAERERKEILLEGGETAVLRCDPDWMAEAVGNLIKNALDHTGPGGSIQISWTETPVMTQITVRDDGEGILPEEFPHIFKRFYRSRLSRDARGAGLGLALTKSIAEAHGGTVSAAGIPGKGSVFTLDFPKLTNL